MAVALRADRARVRVTPTTDVGRELLDTVFTAADVTRCITVEFCSADGSQANCDAFRTAVASMSIDDLTQMLRGSGRAIPADAAQLRHDVVADRLGMFVSEAPARPANLQSVVDVSRIGFEGVGTGGVGAGAGAGAGVSGAGWEAPIPHELDGARVAADTTTHTTNANLPLKADTPLPLQRFASLGAPPNATTATATNNPATRYADALQAHLTFTIVDVAGASEVTSGVALKPWLGTVFYVEVQPPTASLTASPSLTSTLHARLAVNRLRWGAGLPVSWLQANMVDASCDAAIRATGQTDIVTAVKEEFLARLTRPFLRTGATLGCPRGVLFWGPPGSGKTKLAVELMQAAGFNILFAKEAADLNRPLVGGTERVLQYMAKVAASQPWRPFVLVIDEIESLAKSREGSSQSSNKSDILNKLLGQIGGMSDAPNLFIIGCTNFKALLDEAFLREGRLELHYFVGRASARLANHVLGCKLDERDWWHSMAAYHTELSTLAAGLVVASIRTAAVTAHRRAPGGGEEGYRQLRNALQAARSRADIPSGTVPYLLTSKGLSDDLTGFMRGASAGVYAINTSSQEMTLYMLPADASVDSYVLVNTGVSDTSLACDLARLIEQAVASPEGSFVQLIGPKFTELKTSRGLLKAMEYLNAVFEEYLEYMHAPGGFLPLVLLDLDALLGVTVEVSRNSSQQVTGVGAGAGAGADASEHPRSIVAQVTTATTLRKLSSEVQPAIENFLAAVARENIRVAPGLSQLHVALVSQHAEVLDGVIRATPLDDAALLPREVTAGHCVQLLWEGLALGVKDDEKLAFLDKTDSTTHWLLSGVDHGRLLLRQVGVKVYTAIGELPDPNLAIVAAGDTDKEMGSDTIPVRTPVSIVVEDRYYLCVDSSSHEATIIESPPKSAQTVFILVCVSPSRFMLPSLIP